MTADAFLPGTLTERVRLSVVDPAGEAEAVAPVPASPPWWEAAADKPLPSEPTLRLERVGQSYRVRLRVFDAEFFFREVRTSGELSADLTVYRHSVHLFRSTVTLSLAGREKVAKTAQMQSGDGSPDEWRRATHAAVEAVLEAEERIGSPVDLRTAELQLPAGGTHVARPLWPVGSVVLVSPGDAGKSTIARALAVSLASGTTVIPGIEPVSPPRPVLYVAGEDPVAYWHSRSIEAICRGVSLERGAIAEPIQLFDASGRPLHRIARAVSERAADFGAVILDSQQALLAPLDAGGGIRDRDGMFWNAVDQLGVPVLLIAHPNRADARGWSKDADGRIAGSEVNRDRARMAWRVTWEDGKALAGDSWRSYTLTNVKNNHGPRQGALAFAAAWSFGFDDADPGMLVFCPAKPVYETGKLSPELAAALEQYEAGHTTPARLAAALNLNNNTAKSRLRLLRERGLVDGSDEPS